MFLGILFQRTVYRNLYHDSFLLINAIGEVVNYPGSRIRILNKSTADLMSAVRNENIGRNFEFAWSFYFQKCIEMIKQGFVWCYLALLLTLIYIS